jgi:hypothetical protein
VRVRALALVLLLALAIRTFEPDPGARRAALLLVALGLGYGHQLGAWWFGRKRKRTGLERALRVCTLATVSVGFALAFGSVAYPAMVVLAGLAAWHVFENDRALAHASPARVGLPPLPRRLSAHAPVLLATVVAVAVALGAPRVAPALVGAGLAAELAVWTPEEVIGLLLLYHVLVFAGRSLQIAPHRARIAAIHGLPVLVLLAAHGFSPAAYAWIASPILYLLASALHAVATSLDRGLEPQAG